MKRYTLYTFSALALLLAAAACTQDDAVLLPEAPEGIPMTFTATGLNPTAATTTGTRATVDGDWKGVTAVAIQIGNERPALLDGRKFRHRIGMVPLYRGRDLDTCRGGAGRPAR